MKLAPVPLIEPLAGEQVAGAGADRCVRSRSRRAGYSFQLALCLANGTQGGNRKFGRLMLEQFAPEPARAP